MHAKDLADASGSILCGGSLWLLTVQGWRVIADTLVPCLSASMSPPSVVASSSALEWSDTMLDSSLPEWWPTAKSVEPDQWVQVGEGLLEELWEH